MSTPLEILTYPDRFLLKPTQPVKNINGALQQQIDRMAETLSLIHISEPTRLRRKSRMPSSA